jgi:hypothetical protein
MNSEFDCHVCSLKSFEIPTPISAMKSLSRSRPLISKCTSLSHHGIPLPPPTHCLRTLATVSPPTSRRPETTFSDTLNSGPSFSDFLTSTPESLPGTSHLPEWLKRPIPAGGNFAKIKKDLRGLNLHTGISPSCCPCAALVTLRGMNADDSL